MSTELKRKLRSNSTAAERAFWRLLYPFRTGGFHFRKQVLVGSYYVDFACIHAQLIIEIDGDTHGGELAQRNDETRDAYLRARGFAVLRFSNEDVLKNPDGVFDVVSGVLAGRSERLRGSPPPQPSPQGGGCGPVDLANVGQKA